MLQIFDNLTRQASRGWFHEDVSTPIIVIKQRAMNKVGNSSSICNSPRDQFLGLKLHHDNGRSNIL